VTADPLDAFTTPITSGTKPAPTSAGRLSRTRRRMLTRQLDDLAAARANAAIRARSYPIRSGGPRGH
jgi:hypothetical protein